jgi:chaperonin GroEL
MINNVLKLKQDVVFGSEARKGLLEGAEILYNAVKTTMGPSGKNIIIDRVNQIPQITKDGVTVAKAINLKKKLPSLGAELLKEVASKTNENAGDGTTTATVLGFSLLKQGHKMIEAGANPILFKQGMDLATSDVIKSLVSTPVRNEEDIINIGTISANGDKTIGELISNAIKLVGPDGIITIEPTKSFNTTLDVVEGMQIESGFISPYFITNPEKNIVELENPYILLTNRKLSNLQEIIPVLELVVNENRSLLIIGDEIEGEVLHSLIVNKMKDVLKCCAIKAAGFGDYRIDLLRDIALLTSGNIFDAGNELSLKKATSQDLGNCKKIIVSRTTTTFVCDTDKDLSIKDKIATRIEEIKGSLGEQLTDNQRHNQRKRLAKLAGGIAVIKVGGSSEPEIFEKKDRVEDALNATIAAVQEGIVPGGGTALFKTACMLEKQQRQLTGDKKAGYLSVLQACKEPLRTIVENTGKSPEVVCEKLQSADEGFEFGYDAAQEKFGDMILFGIIDPAKVAKHALQHASSVVGTVLTCGGVIMNENESELVKEGVNN